MSRIRTAAVAGAVLVPILAGGFIAQDRGGREGARLFDQVYSLVSARFVDTVDTAALYEKAARGLVTQLQDPYSELLSPKQLTEFNTNTGGRYGGLGMQIEEQQGKGVTVSKVFPHTPAEGNGVREGDVIIAIDTINTRGWKNAQVSDRLRGEPGTKVTVTFFRPGVAQPIKMTFTRATVHIPAVPFAITFGKTGYIPLQQFNETAAQEVVDALQKVRGEGATSVVLDMRGNPGGFLDQALSVSNIFLQPGQEILSVRGRDNEVQRSVARARPLVPTNMPIVILTDGYTASASEIVAGALQDHDRALIVGTTSFGKGLVQSVYPLDGGYALKLTTAKWFTPSGRSIQKERKLLPSGEFVEVHPDSLESDSARKSRPKFKSDAGRVVYGGGAITPDLVVKPDTFSSAEQEFRKAIAPKSPEWYVTLYDYALSLKDKVTPTFTVRPEWRDELYTRMQKAGVNVDRKLYEGAAKYVDYELRYRTARLAMGDSAAKRMTLDIDVQLKTALDVLQKGSSQADLFSIATAATPRK